jgi:hypothetical protein
MYAFTDSFVGLILDWGGNIGTPTRPSAFYAALHSGYPGLAGASNELTGGSYARTVFTPTRSGRVLSNTANIDFPPATVAWSEALFASFWSAASSGTCYGYAPLGSGLSRQVAIRDTTGDTVEYPAHGFSLNDRVFIQQIAGISLPTGLTKDTVYYVTTVTTDTFQLSTTSGGGAINITGSGAFTIQKITNARTAQIGDVIRFAAGALQFSLPSAG